MTPLHRDTVTSRQCYTQLHWYTVHRYILTVLYSYTETPWQTVTLNITQIYLKFSIRRKRIFGSITSTMLSYLSSYKWAKNIIILRWTQFFNPKLALQQTAIKPHWNTVTAKVRDNISTSVSWSGCSMFSARRLKDWFHQLT